MNQLFKDKDDKYTRIISHMSVVCMLLYGFIRCLQYADAGEFSKVLAVGPLSLVPAIIMLIVPRKTRDSGRLAFRIPAITVSWFIISSMLVGGSPHFFMVLVSLCCLSGMYFNYKSYWRFLLMTNAVVFVLVLVFRFPVTGPGVPFRDVVVSWLISILGMLFPTVITKVATGRHKQSLMTQDYFRTALSLAPDLLMLLDEKNCVTYVSDTLSRYSHIKITELAVGQPVLDLFPLLDMKLLLSEVLDTRGLHEVTRELEIDGETLFLKIITDEMWGGTKGRFIDICDVTSIMKAKVAAEQAARAKSEFLARMSHEIRTPMNAISGMTELILRESLSPNAAEHATAIKQASVNLLSIINDILDYSKIESGHMEILPVNYRFSSMINDVVSIIRMRVMEKPVLFVVNIDSNIPNLLVGDEVRIRQVLLNILSNAVKFTSEGHISLSVTGEFTGPHEITLTAEVADSGRGIKKDDVDKLFGDFVQLSSTSRQGAEGTGLGLSISRNLLRQMGGSISVESAFGVGSTFTMTIPQTFITYEKYASVENPEQKSVLVYEPRSIYADSIACSVDNLGVRCSLALTQSEFYEKLQKNHYPFVFISSFLLEKAGDIIEKLGINTKLVLLAEFGDLSLSTQYTTMSMPVHSISVANLLNGVRDELSYSASNEQATRFVAPRARVLVVDDISTNLRVASGLMAPYQIQVDTCLSGREAIELIKANSYDMVFLDHMMPHMDGVEAAERIRALPGEQYARLPIIALTANAVSGMREMFLQNGFSDFLAKPVETPKLHAALEKWIQREKQEAPPAREAESAEPLLEIKGVNVRQGVSRTGGTMAHYLQTLAVFHREATEKHSQLLECLSRGDMALYTVYVHALRGAAASIGATHVSELANQLEQAAHEHDVRFIEAHNDELLDELQELQGNIYPVIGGQTEAASGENSADVLREQLLRLRTALEALDLAAMDEAAATLSAFSVGEKEMLDAVLSNVLLGEYESAVHCINSMLKSQFAT